MDIITATLALIAALVNCQQAINEAPQPQEEPQQVEEQVYDCELYCDEPEAVQQVGYIDASEGYVEEAGYEQADGYSGGLTAQSGVNYYDGRTETFYSSAVLWHYRTNEWMVDDEGFYRDPEGRYVVAASDMEQGTVFQGSKGECIVLDSGCAAGVTDYYVNWL